MVIDQYLHLSTPPALLTKFVTLPEVPPITVSNNSFGRSEIRKEKYYGVNQYNTVVKYSDTSEPMTANCYFGTLIKWRGQCGTLYFSLLKNKLIFIP